MASVHDVAKYILKRLGSTTAMQLQKLLYYGQAWSLVWDDKALFRARICAWANGPVIPVIYGHHRGQFILKDWPLGDPSNLTQDEIETVDAVINFYGKKTAQFLSDLTHRERPWRDARKGLEDGERGSSEISLSSLHEYYGSLGA